MTDLHPRDDLAQLFADWQAELLSPTPNVTIIAAVELTVEREYGLDTLEALKTQGLTAAFGKWDPDLHPRGKDGRFIEIGGWIKTVVDLLDGNGRREHRGQVLGITKDVDSPGNPKINVGFKNITGDIKELDVASNAIQAADDVKAILDGPDVPGNLPDLDRDQLTPNEISAGKERLAELRGVVGDLEVNNILDGSEIGELEDSLTEVDLRLDAGNRSSVQEGLTDLRGIVDGNVDFHTGEGNTEKVNALSDFGTKVDGVHNTFGSDSKAKISNDPADWGLTPDEFKGEAVKRGLVQSDVDKIIEGPAPSAESKRPGRKLVDLEPIDKDALRAQAADTTLTDRERVAAKLELKSRGIDSTGDSKAAIPGDVEEVSATDLLAPSGRDVNSEGYDTDVSGSYEEFIDFDDDPELFDGSKLDKDIIEEALGGALEDLQSGDTAAAADKLDTASTRLHQRADDIGLSEDVDSAGEARADRLRTFADKLETQRDDLRNNISDVDEPSLSAPDASAKKLAETPWYMDANKAEGLPDDYGKTRARTLSDEDLDAQISKLEDDIAAGKPGMSNKIDLQVLNNEKAARLDPAAADNISDVDEPSLSAPARSVNDEGYDTKVSDLYDEFVSLGEDDPDIFRDIPFTDNALDETLTSALDDLQNGDSISAADNLDTASDALHQIADDIGLAEDVDAAGEARADKIRALADKIDAQRDELSAADSAVDGNVKQALKDIEANPDANSPGVDKLLAERDAADSAGMQKAADAKLEEDSVVLDQLSSLGDDGIAKLDDQELDDLKKSVENLDQYSADDLEEFGGVDPDEALNTINDEIASRAASVDGSPENRIGFAVDDYRKGDFEPDGMADADLNGLHELVNTPGLRDTLSDPDKPIFDELLKDVNDSHDARAVDAPDNLTVPSPYLADSQSNTRVDEAYFMSDADLQKAATREAGGAFYETRKLAAQAELDRRAANGEPEASPLDKRLYDVALNKNLQNKYTTEVADSKAAFDTLIAERGREKNVPLDEQMAKLDDSDPLKQAYQRNIRAQKDLQHSTTNLNNAYKQLDKTAAAQDPSLTKQDLRDRVAAVNLDSTNDLSRPSLKSYEESLKNLSDEDLAKLAERRDVVPNIDGDSGPAQRLAAVRNEIDARKSVPDVTPDPNFGDNPAPSAGTAPRSARGDDLYPEDDLLARLYEMEVDDIEPSSLKDRDLLKTYNDIQDIDPADFSEADLEDLSMASILFEDVINERDLRGPDGSLYTPSSTGVWDDPEGDATFFRGRNKQFEAGRIEQDAQSGKWNGYNALGENIGEFDSREEAVNAVDSNIISPNAVARIKGEEALAKPDLPEGNTEEINVAKLEFDRKNAARRATQTAAENAREDAISEAATQYIKDNPDGPTPPAPLRDGVETQSIGESTDASVKKTASVRNEPGNGKFSSDGSYIVTDDGKYVTTVRYDPASSFDKREKQRREADAIAARINGEGTGAPEWRGDKLKYIDPVDGEPFNGAEVSVGKGKDGVWRAFDTRVAGQPIIGEFDSKDAAKAAALDHELSRYNAPGDTDAPGSPDAFSSADLDADAESGFMSSKILDKISHSDDVENDITTYLDERGMDINDPELRDEVREDVTATTLMDKPSLANDAIREELGENIAVSDAGVDRLENDLGVELGEFRRGDSDIPGDGNADIPDPNAPDAAAPNESDGSSNKRKKGRGLPHPSARDATGIPNAGPDGAAGGPGAPGGLDLPKHHDRVDVLDDLNDADGGLGGGLPKGLDLSKADDVAKAARAYEDGKLDPAKLSDSEAADLYAGLDMLGDPDYTPADGLPSAESTKNLVDDLNKRLVLDEPTLDTLTGPDVKPEFNGDEYDFIDGIKSGPGSASEPFSQSAFNYESDHGWVDDGGYPGDKTLWTPEGEYAGSIEATGDGNFDARDSNGTFESFPTAEAAANAVEQRHLRNTHPESWQGDELQDDSGNVQGYIEEAPNGGFNAHDAEGTQIGWESTKLEAQKLVEGPGGNALGRDGSDASVNADAPNADAPNADAPKSGDDRVASGDLQAKIFDRIGKTDEVEDRITDLLDGQGQNIDDINLRDEIRDDAISDVLTDKPSLGNDALRAELSNSDQLSDESIDELEEITGSDLSEFRPKVNPYTGEPLPKEFDTQSYDNPVERVDDALAMHENGSLDLSKLSDADLGTLDESIDYHQDPDKNDYTSGTPEAYNDLWDSVRAERASRKGTPGTSDSTGSSSSDSPDAPSSGSASNSWDGDILYGTDADGNIDYDKPLGGYEESMPLGEGVNSSKKKYLAVAADGEQVGSFDSPEEAQSALEKHLDDAPDADPLDGDGPLPRDAFTDSFSDAPDRLDAALTMYDKDGLDPKELSDTDLDQLIDDVGSADMSDWDEETIGTAELLSTDLAGERARRDGGLDAPSGGPSSDAPSTDGAADDPSVDDTPDGAAAQSGNYLPDDGSLPRSVTVVGADDDEGNVLVEFKDGTTQTVPRNSIILDDGEPLAEAGKVFDGGDTIDPDGLDTPDLKQSQDALTDTVDDIASDSVGTALDGHEVRVGSKLVSAKDGVSGTVTGWPDQEKYPGTVYVKPDDGGKIKARNIRTLKEPGSKAEGAPKPAKNAKAPDAVTPENPALGVNNNHGKSWPENDTSNFIKNWQEGKGSRFDMNAPSDDNEPGWTQQLDEGGDDDYSVLRSDNLTAIASVSKEGGAWEATDTEGKYETFDSKAEALEAAENMAVAGDTNNHDAYLKKQADSKAYSDKVNARLDAADAADAESNVQAAPPASATPKSSPQELQARIKARRAEAESRLDEDLRDSENPNYTASMLLDDIKEAADRDFPGWRKKKFDRKNPKHYTMVKPPGGYETTMFIGDIQAFLPEAP